MANPDLVAYLRKHWRHGPQTLRQKLVDEGVDEGEVDAALIEATPKPKPDAKKRLPFAVAGGLLSALLVFWALKSGSQNAARRPGSKQVLIQENPNDPHKAFVGHYGYILRLPLGYEAVSDFLDPRKRDEVAYLFPKGTDLTNLRDEGLYKPLGILRLEVRPRPRGIPEGRPGLLVLQRQIEMSMKSRKLAFTVKEQLVGGLPAFVAVTKDPSAKAQAFVVGGRFVYSLIGGSDDQLFMDTLQSLHEVGETPANP